MKPDLIQVGGKSENVEAEHVAPSRFQADNQRFTLMPCGRNNVMFHCFPPHCATPLYRCWYCWSWAGLLFTHYSLSRLPPPSPPNPDELKWTQPLSPSQQLGVTDFKARDMNNQTVIFSFSSSCYWPDFMIFSLPPSLPPYLPLFSLSCMLSHANPLPSRFLSQYLSSSQISIHLFCPLQIADLYKKQQQIQNQGEKADPEDFYWTSVVISRE